MISKGREHDKSQIDKHMRGAEHSIQGSANEGDHEYGTRAY